MRDNGDEFIGEWIECMFDKANVIVNDQIEFYKNMLKIEDENKLRTLVRNLNTVTVIGYNSPRFDTNLMKPYLNTKGNWFVNNKGLLGASSSMEQLILTHKNGVHLRSIDVMGYISGGILAQFGKDYGCVDNSNKGVFPYEAINSKNHGKCKIAPCIHRTGNHPLIFENWKLFISQ